MVPGRRPDAGSETGSWNSQGHSPFQASSYLEWDLVMRTWIGYLLVALILTTAFAPRRAVAAFFIVQDVGSDTCRISDVRPPAGSSVKAFPLAFATRSEAERAAGICKRAI